jgi:two-component system, OmpR family, sensor histidine kinase VicK
LTLKRNNLATDNKIEQSIFNRCWLLNKKIFTTKYFILVSDWLFSLTNSVSPYFTYHHNDNNISPANNYSANHSRKTKVIYGGDDVIDTALQFTSNARNKIDACVDHTRPSLIVEIQSVKRVFGDAKKRGVKLRCITEIRTENVSCCKVLLTSVVNELRYLDGIKGTFYVSEKEYIAPAARHEKDRPSSQIIHSNMKEIVEEQQYLFDTLWSKSIPAEVKIKEIEHGIEPEYFRVINDNEEATNILIDLVRNAQYEVLILLPNDKALTRIDRLGMLDYLIDKCNKKANGRGKEGGGGENEFQAKIICPLSDANLNIVNRILQNTSPSYNNIRIVNGNNSSFGIIIVDNNKFLKAELREPEAEQFSEAIGLSFYSNSNPSVESYKLFFELLWNERTANEQFKLNDKMQREFINIAAHELRTPAQSVLGYAELMRENVLDKQSDIGESMEAIEAIYRNAVRLQKLTNDILDVSRIESQTLSLNKEFFELSELIAGIVQDYKSYLRRHGKSNSNNKNLVQLFNITSQSDDFKFIVEADRNRINQAISNIINNAIKFTSQKGGMIAITTEKGNNKYYNQEVIISVIDTGEGIHPEIIPRLFTKFASRSNSGTGLGLYISKSIVEAHGGRIWAENNSDGMGATFSFSLPMTQ